MRAKIVCLLTMVLISHTCLAALDINQADQAELEAIPGIGTALAQRILDERKKGNFQDWEDLQKRVKGIREKNAAHFAQQGLTVNGQVLKTK